MKVQKQQFVGHDHAAQLAPATVSVHALTLGLPIPELGQFDCVIASWNVETGLERFRVCTKTWRRGRRGTFHVF
jgi:N6-adenosine-specific RNA methylase IME4